jgi:FkbM family methyltransferase
MKQLPRTFTTRLLQVLLRSRQLEVVAPYGQCDHRIIIYPDGMFAPIINQREYGEQKEVKFLRRYLSPDMTIFDVGANIGVYTLLFYEYTTKGQGRIFSFEPVPATFRRLENNIAINRIPADRISVHNLALFDRNGNVTINVYDQKEFSGLNTIGERNLRIGGKKLSKTSVEITCQTMDDFVADRNLHGIDLIKVDVEGSEFAVLRGGAETIRKCARNELFTVMIEISDHTLMGMNVRARELLDYASQLGLQICEYLPDANQLVSHQTKDYYVNENLFFCANIERINAHLLRV